MFEVECGKTPCIKSASIIMSKFEAGNIYFKDKKEKMTTCLKWGGI